MPSCRPVHLEPDHFAVAVVVRPPLVSQIGDEVKTAPGARGRGVVAGGRSMRASVSYLDPRTSRIATDAKEHLCRGVGEGIGHDLADGQGGVINPLRFLRELQRLADHSPGFRCTRRRGWKDMLMP